MPARIARGGGGAVVKWDGANLVFVAARSGSATLSVA
jgi:hypothetical protein